jgi:hypothetical protein
MATSGNAPPECAAVAAADDAAAEPDAPPGAVLAYARLVAARAASLSGGRLLAAYLHGSAVLGGWTAARSDVDLLLVTGGDLPGQMLDAVAGAVVAAGADCPGAGLECSMVTAAQAAGPRPPWPFLLHVNLAAGQRKVVSGAGHAGDPDLLMHYVVCRSAGVPVLGPAPGELIGAVPRPAILGYLADELGWGLAHGSEAYAVLNACRALIFLADGEIVSKVAGGLAALDRGLGDAAAIERALDQQRGNAPPAAIEPAAAAFVRSAAAVLRDAAARPMAD